MAHRYPREEHPNWQRSSRGGSIPWFERLSSALYSALSSLPGDFTTMPIPNIPALAISPSSLSLSPTNFTSVRWEWIAAIAISTSRTPSTRRSPIRRYAWVATMASIPARRISRQTVRCFRRCARVGNREIRFHGNAFIKCLNLPTSITRSMSNEASVASNVMGR